MDNLKRHVWDNGDVESNDMIGLSHRTTGLGRTFNSWDQGAEAA